MSASTMTKHVSFVSSFLVFMFCMQIPDVHPFRLYRSYEESQRSMTGDDPNVRIRINWSKDGGNMNLPKLDYLPPRSTPLARTERSEISAHTSRRKCSHGFCEEVDDYPEDLIRNVLKRSSNLNEYFREEVTFNLNNRGGFDDEEDSNDTLCPVRSVTRYPRTARNTKKQERLLINVEGHKQGIVFETCIEDVQTCKFSESFPAGYVSSCKQKYVKRRLATLDADNQTTSWDIFEVPSCCVCIIKRE
ncbi:hypothetical protein WA026_005523 [Henosepilachna vigintioctopunctata]|uniref:Spaetzle domain-containing protein n=1 Tax=Henosepilachna vigintioctopunctata TaxID=420089 RepID=A0AAW1TWP2_9CUCU